MSAQPITVRALLALLAKEPPDNAVVLQSDSEGNWFANLAAYDDTAPGKTILIPGPRRRDP